MRCSPSALLLVGCATATPSVEDDRDPAPPPVGSTVICTSTPAWLDSDGDGFGDPATEFMACGGSEPGQVANAGDCNDAEPLAWTGAPEAACDGVDNDCDGQVPQCSRSFAEGAGRLEADAVRSAALIGDTDGDGLDDLAVQAERSTGTTWLVPGAVLPGATGLASAAAVATLDEPTGTERQGVFPAGDTDADGLDDYWVAAPLRLVRGGLSGDLGAVDVTIDLASYAPSLVAFSGDVDGDGIRDVLASDGHDITLFRGPFAAGTTPRSDAVLEVVPTAEAYASRTVDAADIDGDGLPEALVGTDCSDGYGGVGGPWEDVTAGAIPGTSTGRLALSDRDAFSFHVECSAALTYGSAHFVGDVDGDGHVDLGLAGADATWVVLGSLVGPIDPAATAHLVVTFGLPDRPTGSPQTVGDVDGDGFDDLIQLTAGPTLDGTLHVIRGGRSGTLGPADTDAIWAGEATDEALGMAMRATTTGDADADGLLDVIVTAPDGSLFWLPGSSLLGP